MEIKNPAQYIDHTNINPHATHKDIVKTSTEAKHHKFRGVCVHPEWAKTVSHELHGTGIKTIVLLDAPIGGSHTLERVSLAKAARRHGAEEIDVVARLSDIKHDKYDRVLQDLKKICGVLPTKVIIGSGYLTSDEIRKVSEIVKEAGAVCVKTSTFKDPLDHFELEEKARHLQIMKKAAPGLKIKAAGKIATSDDMKMMIGSGADIIGTSSSLQIMNGFKDKYAE